MMDPRTAFVHPHFSLKLHGIEEANEVHLPLPPLAS